MRKNQYKYNKITTKNYKTKIFPQKQKTFCGIGANFIFEITKNTKNYTTRDRPQWYSLNRKL